MCITINLLLIPSNPHAQFEIAERLSTPTDTTTDPWRTRLNAKFHALFQDKEDFSGDVVPGSLEAPQALPISSPSEEMTLYERLCALFMSAESDFGYEGKEAEMRRPQGARDWQKSYGGFRRK
jgi:hypothetical protein